MTGYSPTFQNRAQSGFPFPFIRELPSSLGRPRRKDCEPHFGLREPSGKKRRGARGYLSFSSSLTIGPTHNSVEIVPRAQSGKIRTLVDFSVRTEKKRTEVFEDGSQGAFNPH